ncbi:multidrug resistance transporter [Scheffersomyces xylosifermentans]|uniref:multidrug resistance transporter n=1 Tax=Scheffersomyces xylosifermentans TaxID=1304137 RepID=UPI00315C9732
MIDEGSEINDVGGNGTCNQICTHCDCTGNTDALSVVQQTSEVEAETEEDHQVPPCSILKSHEKYFLVILLSLSGMLATSSSSIYFPALPILAKKFGVSDGVVNLSVVGYLLFQGLGPSFIASLADTYGRRPCLIACLLTYTIVCIGLSRTNTFWLLAVLRCFQAALLSPSLNISAGVIGDMCPPSERGGFIGILMGIQLVGQGFGALVGAEVISKFGWRGIFVCLAIGSGTVLLFAAILMPESNRKLVGNLSIPPKRLINCSPIVHFEFMKKRMNNDISTLSDRTPLDMFLPYKILFTRRVFFILLPVALQFTTWTMSLTTLSTSLESKYGFSIMQIGLCYLSPGLGVLTGSLVTGRLLDYIFARKQKAYDKDYGDMEKSQRPTFDILKTRIQFAFYPSCLLILSTIAFGWCLQYRIHLAPILISSFIISFCSISFISAINTLLVDLFPGQSTAATSCLVLLRCVLGAAGVGALQSMVDRMGVGGCYTLMAGLCLISAGELLRVMTRPREQAKEEEISINSYAAC